MRSAVNVALLILSAAGSGWVAVRLLERGTRVATAIGIAFGIGALFWAGVAALSVYAAHIRPRRIPSRH
jgi:hypothetical protein